jgi:Kef-type K+ transport system membrane component KefB
MEFFLILGIMVVVGYLGGKGGNRLKAPQVVGYIVAGVIIGTSGLNLLSLGVSQQLKFLSSFALGLIGFSIGGELVFYRLKELGRSIIVISVLESLGAFFLVGIAVLIYSRSVPTALIFGALSSATAPAATVDVLWEYNSKGPLTSTLFAVVGIDDAVALIIYSFAASIAGVMLRGGEMSLFQVIRIPVQEILGSIVVGLLAGLILNYFIRNIRDRNELLSLTLGTILICSGLAHRYHLSVILTNMVLGITLINQTPRTSRQAFRAIAEFTPPVYILFFVLVGARLQLNLLPKLGGLGVIYILMRTTGKSLGSYIGAHLSAASLAVKKYLGFGLLSQAGVAIGLALEAWTTFSAYPEGAKLGMLAINVITGTTFVFQILGPPLTKYAIFKAGEVDRRELSKRRH